MAVLLLLALVIGLVGWLWVRNLPAPQRKPAILRLVIIVTVAVVAVLALTGRFYLVMALLAGLLPLLRRMLPGLLLGRLFRGFGLPGMGSGRSTASKGNQSRVRRQVLEMTLDHDSGDMHGRVVQGPLAGTDLADLEERGFMDLLDYCRQTDEDSARLLESYLDRRFGDSWRGDDPAGDGDSTRDHGRADGGAGRAGSLSVNEALEILGLEEGASQEEIIRAHRQMMQKMHPDRGGSTYLASLINEAKDVLTG